MGRKKNPETIITKAMRNLLRLLRTPHFKHFSGALSESGIPNIIGTIPGVPIPEKPVDHADAMTLAKSIKSLPADDFNLTADKALIALAEEVHRLRARGRAFWMEVKTPVVKLSDDQEKFLERHKEAGAVAFMARSPEEMLKALADAGFERAKSLTVQFSGREIKDEQKR